MATQCTASSMISKHSGNLQILLIPAAGNNLRNFQGRNLGFLQRRTPSHLKMPANMKSQIAHITAAKFLPILGVCVVFTLRSHSPQGSSTAFQTSPILFSSCETLVSSLLNVALKQQRICIDNSELNGPIISFTTSSCLHLKDHCIQQCSVVDLSGPEATHNLELEDF